MDLGGSKLFTTQSLTDVEKDEYERKIETIFKALDTERVERQYANNQFTLKFSKAYNLQFFASASNLDTGIEVGVGYAKHDSCS